jgi:hypothetical protein
MGSGGRPPSGSGSSNIVKVGLFVPGPTFVLTLGEVEHQLHRLYRCLNEKGTFAAEPGRTHTF